MKNSKELFVCTSYHHIMTALAKKRCNETSMDLIVSNYSTGDEYWIDILPKLKEYKLFDNIFYFDERKHHPPKPTRILATYIYEFVTEEKIIKKIKGLDLKKYNLVYLIDDKMFPASTIIKHNIPYHLLEDTAMTYQYMNKLGTSKIMKLPYRYICVFFRFLRYWHPVFGYANCCKAIEVSSSDNLPDQLPKDKLVVVDRNKMIRDLPITDIKVLCEIFLGQYSLEYLKQKTNMIIIFTSLYRRGRQYADEQIRICQKLMSKFKNYKFIIKPHPRDLTNYKEAFPDTIVLDRRFPSELLNYIDGIAVDYAISVCSTAVDTCNFAKITKYYTLADVGEYIPYE